MKQISDSVHIGTSSWLFDSWRGVFYPDKLARSLYLDHYSRAFDTVEVNTSFYAIPAPSTVIGWVTGVPPGFSYALKFPRSISHELKLVGAESQTLTFLEVLRSMGAAAAPAFLQLPPDFTRRLHGRSLAAYLDWLATQADDLRIAVEVRSADLATQAFATFLADRGFSLVLVDRVNTPDLWDGWLALVEARRAPSFAFIRWIGDDKNGPQGDRELQLQRDDDLLRWAERIVRLVEAGIDVYGYMHNPFEGHSPASVRRLLALLAERINLPAWRPQPAPPVDDGQQLSLF
jgi:uncharacterized protein YecE (DUF72 family)